MTVQRAETAGLTELVLVSNATIQVDELETACAADGRSCSLPIRATLSATAIGMLPGQNATVVFRSLVEVRVKSHTSLKAQTRTLLLVVVSAAVIVRRRRRNRRTVESGGDLAVEDVEGLARASRPSTRSPTQTRACRRAGDRASTTLR